MKTCRLLITIAFLCSWYHGFTIGAGLQLSDALEQGRRFSIYADASLPILPVLYWRQGILELNLPDEGTSLALGTGLSSDLLFFIPADMPVTPYVVAGLWTRFNETAVSLDLRAGLGGQTDIGPLFGYLELGTDFSLVKPDQEDLQTDFPLFARLGVRRPLKFKIRH